LLVPNEVQTCGILWNLVGVTPSARILRLRAPKIFFPTRSPGPLSGDLWHLRLPAKHGGASFTLRIGIETSGFQLVGLLEVAFAWRWRLAPNCSPSKERFNPDEPNLQSLMSS
jgi:hypothetical protein